MPCALDTLEGENARPPTGPGTCSPPSTTKSSVSSVRYLFDGDPFSVNSGWLCYLDVEIANSSDG